MHIRFKNFLDALSIRINGTTYKHCSFCGLRFRGEDKKLEAHYRRYHKDQEAAWLSFDDPPVHCCYSNFETYLQNPDTELRIKPNFRFSGGGPLHSTKPPLFDVIRPEISEIDSWYPKRQRVESDLVS